MPGRESRTAHWTSLQRCEHGDQPHLSPLNNSDISTSIDSDAGLKASSLQAVSSNLDPSHIWISCRQEKQDMGFIAIDRTIAAPDTTVVLNNHDFLYVLLLSLICFALLSFGNRPLAKLQINWAQGPSFILLKETERVLFTFVLPTPGGF